MRGLTNEQRKCFGLIPIEPDWDMIKLKPSPYDNFDTFAYLHETVIKKCVVIGETTYREYELHEQLSNDLQYLLPKTAKGKPTRLSSSTLSKRTGAGMHLLFKAKRKSSYLALFSDRTNRNYYTSIYEGLNLWNLEEFYQWAEQWRADSTPEDIEDIAGFAADARKHIQFKEGDVFRYKINRRLYGYGRVLLDYAQMRKNKEAFWDCLMMRPVVCSAYHIVTDNKALSVEDLAHLKSLPSVITADNHLFYGEYEIIGNIPVGEHEDYPILYGRHHSPGMGNTVHLQWGKLFRTLEPAQPLYHQFQNNGVSFDLNVRLPVLLECIAEDSNEPYWSQPLWFTNDNDLRNPKFKTELNAVCRQFDLPLFQP